MNFSFSKVTEENVVKLRRKPTLHTNKKILPIIVLDLVEQELSAFKTVIGEPHRHWMYFIKLPLFPCNSNVSHGLYLFMIRKNGPDYFKAINRCPFGVHVFKRCKSKDRTQI